MFCFCVLTDLCVSPSRGGFHHNFFLALGSTHAGHEQTVLML